jgi:DNA-binding NtrC family response regulator
MPVMDGMEVLKQIKEIDQAIVVIMVTVLKDEKAAQNAIKLGAYDYVTKPLSFDYLEKAAVLVKLHLKAEE